MPIDLMLTAFLMGLFGSVHCIGMCGGIIGTLSMSLSTQLSPKPKKLIWYVLNYNLGRIASYVLVGLLFGFISQSTFSSSPNFQQYSMIITGGFMIALGLYISQLWMGLSKIEQWLSPAWSKIQPLANSLLPPKTVSRAIPLGMVWGWLPCGLVYSALPVAFSAGSPSGAAFVMLAFGIATLPTLMLLGNSSVLIKQKMQNKTLRLILGFVLILWGLMQIFGISLMSSGMDHMNH